MKELSKEDQDLHQRAVLHANSPPKDFSTDRVHEMISKLEIVAYKTGAKEERKIAYNQAIEDVNRILWDGRINNRTSLAEMLESIENLKK